MNLQRKLYVAALFSLFSINSVYSYYVNTTANYLNFSPSWVTREETLLRSVDSSIETHALHTALVAYYNAQKLGYQNKPLLTVIDYSLPSTSKRLWVFDLRTNHELFNTWVSHGKNSGGIDATSFSNNPSSLKTSIGVYVTADTYMGKNGYSLRLRGLDSGFNDNAYRRDIVMHGARYVNTGKLAAAVGRSWGCPAVNPKLAKPIIDTIKDKTIIVAYYPDHGWLTHSQFLT